MNVGNGRKIGRIRAFDNLKGYGFVRLLPKVEREEFINVGLILFSKSAKYLKAKFNIDESRLACYRHELDLDEIKSRSLRFHLRRQGRFGRHGLGRLALPIPMAHGTAQLIDTDFEATCRIKY